MQLNMIYSSLKLPPKVFGPQRGLLSITIEDFWLQTAQRNCSLRLAFWGSTHADKIDLSTEEKKTIVYTVHVPEHTFKNYLRDAHEFVFTLHLNDNEDSPLVGIVSIDMYSLLAHENSSLATLPVMSNSTQIGSLSLKISFEDSPNPKFSIQNTILTTDAPQYASSSQNSTPKSSLSPTTSPRHCSLHVSISSAFQLNITNVHLPTGEYDDMGISFVYCSISSRPMQSLATPKTTTHLAAVHEVPPLGHSVVWNAQFDIPLSDTDFHFSDFEMENAFQVHQRPLRPKEISPPNDTLHAKEHSLLLSLNVWRSRGPHKDPADLLAAMASNSHRESAVASPRDVLIGSCVVDAMPFLSDAVLRHGSGDNGHGKEKRRVHTTTVEDKFELVNAAHERQGVIKVCIEPNHELLAWLVSKRIGCASGSHICSSDDTGDDGDDAVDPCIDAVSHGPLTTATTMDVPLASYDGTVNGNPPPGPAAVLPCISAPRVPAHDTTGHTVRDTKEKKVQYAWSGSDSDDDLDGMAMVGMAFEGAVSCSDDEYTESFQSPPLSTHGDARETTRAEGKETQRNQRQLIDDDWLFDISRPVNDSASHALSAGAADNNSSSSSKKNIEEDSGEVPNLVAAMISAMQAHDTSIEKSDGTDDTKPAIKFKNALLPGVVSAGPLFHLLSSMHSASIAAPHRDECNKRAASLMQHHQQHDGPAMHPSRPGSSKEENNDDENEGLHEKKEGTLNGMPSSVIGNDAGWMFDIKKVGARSESQEKTNTLLRSGPIACAETVQPKISGSCDGVQEIEEQEQQRYSQFNPMHSGHQQQSSAKVVLHNAPAHLATLTDVLNDLKLKQQR